MMLRSSQDTIHVVLSALFQFATADLPGDASRILTFDPTCDVISNLQIECCNIFGSLNPGLPNAAFGARNRPVVWQTDSKGPKRLPPPLSPAGRVRKYQ